MKKYSFGRGNIAVRVKFLIHEWQNDRLSQLFNDVMQPSNGSECYVRINFIRLQIQESRLHQINGYKAHQGENHKKLTNSVCIL